MKLYAIHSSTQLVVDKVYNTYRKLCPHTHCFGMHSDEEYNRVNWTCNVKNDLTPIEKHLAKWHESVFEPVRIGFVVLS